MAWIYYSIGLGVKNKRLGNVLLERWRNTDIYACAATVNEVIHNDNIYLCLQNIECICPDPW